MSDLAVIKLPDSEDDRNSVTELLRIIGNEAQEGWNKAFSPYKAPEILPLRALCISKIAETLLENGNSADAYDRTEGYKPYIKQEIMSEAIYYILGFMDGIKMKHKLAKTAS